MQQELGINRLTGESNVIGDILRAVFARKATIIYIVVASVALSAGLAYLLPAKYKTRAVIALESSYFQNPMIGDLISGIYDPGELRLLRELLIRKSLNNEYLNQMGEKHRLFSFPATDSRRGLEVEALKAQIEVVGVSANTFQVAFTAKNAALSYEICRETLDRISEVIVSEKRALVVRLRDAIRKRIESVGSTLDRSSVGVGVADSDGIRAEIDRLNTEMAALKLQLADRHPRVIQLKNRIQVLSAALPGSIGASTANVREQATPEIRQELIKKYNYIGIVLDVESKANASYLTVLENPQMPTGPIFPKRLSFLISGFAGGLMVALAAVFFQEFGNKLNVVFRMDPRPATQAKKES